MVTINYSITFHGDWHCSSGLAAGAELDTLVIKDRRGLPYVPGKTIKGLFREQAELLIKYMYPDFSEIFLSAMGEIVNADNIGMSGTMFFSNATFNEQTASELEKHNLSALLYHTIASTKIDNEGVAEQHSLRSIQVVVPCTLYGTIENVPTEIVTLVEKGLQLIKRLGTHRPRGLGRCEFHIVNMED